MGKAWRKLLIVVFILLCSLPLLADDTKFFGAFAYVQPGIMGSDFSLSPQLRFEHSAKELYYYDLRCGFTFHPKTWLDLGLFYHFVNEKNQSGNWDVDHRIDFVIDPIIVINLLPVRSRATSEAEGAEGENTLVAQVGAGVLRAIELVPQTEFDLEDLDQDELSDINIVGRMKPTIDWEYGFGTIYVNDEIFYSFKYGERFKNWATIGIIRPLNGLALDFYYSYESEKPQIKVNSWEHAHIWGTRLIWDRR
ncbi:MAG: hypothetical protein HQ596_00815 [Candidatus Saganbacteria bacterium]|nr:hypothetical protein [Candidatus Saganbacteria bacterium]